MDVYRHISRLKILKNMPEEQVTALFKLFLDAIKTDEQITEVFIRAQHATVTGGPVPTANYIMLQFLSYLPQNQGGLLPLGFGLFHPSAQVRKYTVDFFNRLDQHVVSPALQSCCILPLPYFGLLKCFLLKVGRKFIQTLNRFQKLAYERLNHTARGNEQSSHRPGTPMGRQQSFGRSPTPTDHLVAG